MQAKLQAKLSPADAEVTLRRLSERIRSALIDMLLKLNTRSKQ